MEFDSNPGLTLYSARIINGVPYVTEGYDPKVARESKDDIWPIAVDEKDLHFGENDAFALALEAAMNLVHHLDNNPPPLSLS